MSSNIIPPDEASLLLHKFVTERVPIVAFLVSPGGDVRVKIQGFVTGFSRDDGVASKWPKKGDPIPGFILISADIFAASKFRYSDETELPPGFLLGSGLRMDLPNGNTLTIFEIRSQQE